MARLVIVVVMVIGDVFFPQAFHKLFIDIQNFPVTVKYTNINCIVGIDLYCLVYG